MLKIALINFVTYNALNWRRDLFILLAHTLHVSRAPADNTVANSWAIVPFRQSHEYWEIYELVYWKMNLLMFKWRCQYFVFPNSVFPFLLVFLLQIGLTGLTSFPLLEEHTGLCYETEWQHCRSRKRQPFEPWCCSGSQGHSWEDQFQLYFSLPLTSRGAGVDVTRRQAGGAKGIVRCSLCPHPAPTAASSIPCLCPLPGEGSFVRSSVQGTKPGQTGRRE